MSTTYHHPFHIARIFNGARSRHQGPHRLERGDLALQERGGELRLQEDDRARRALRARAGASRRSAARSGTASSPTPSCSIARKAFSAIPAKVHLLNFEGEYYNVRGPLPALPSPQGRPVIIQAGQSGPGMDLAAHYADMQFSTRRTMASMKEHRDRARRKARQVRPQAARLRHPVVGAHPGRGIRSRRRARWRSTISIRSRRRPG